MKGTVTIFLILMVHGLSAQFFNKVNWEEHRHQIEWGLGVSNFLGDLGGKDAVGTNDLRDLEKTEFNFGCYLGYKFVIYRKLNLRADLSYARVTGDDKLTLEPFRNNRNLHFRSDLFEFSTLIEYELPINVHHGHIYNIKGANGWKYRELSVFLFAGIGVFNYNPKALVEGKWMALRPLHTEGQGLPGGAKAYNRFSVSIPIGVSFSKRVSKTLSIGFDLSYRYTFTDYIDDVSTVYYSPDDLQLYNNTGTGDLSAYLSNPSLGLTQDGLPNYVTAPGQQRGNPANNDGWMLLTFRFQYLLGEKTYHKGYKKVKFKGRKRKGERITF